MSAFLHYFPLLGIASTLLVGGTLRTDWIAGARRAWLFLGFGTLLACLADWLLLILLPRLGLSFGPVAAPLFYFNLARMACLFLFLPAVLLAGEGWQRTAAAAVAGGLQALLLGVFVYGFYIEPFRLGVTELPASSPSFFPGRPLRILQISDLHIERITRREQDVLAQVRARQPDLIVMTGDFVNLDYLDDPVALQQTRTFLSQLSAPYGVYAVTGTTDLPAVKTAIFSGANVHVLDDEVKTLSFPGGELDLVGVTNTANWGRDRKALESLMETVPVDAYTLLLYHTPDLFEAASIAGVDLYLAGHTHGGQVRLPIYGAVITYSRYGKKYEMGKYVEVPTTLYVSRGLGMEGGGAPRVRFLCPPEIVVIELGK